MKEWLESAEAGDRVVVVGRHGDGRSIRQISRTTATQILVNCGGTGEVSRGPAPTPLEWRFWSKVQPADSGCWEWTGAFHQKGYGVIWVPGGRRAARVHRVCYELCVSPIPQGQFVCHACDNPSCVRPEHLFLGTAADNNRDRMAKGRSRGPMMKTHCKHGHALVGANIMADGPDHPRRCRICKRASRARSRERQNVAVSATQEK